MTTTIAFDVYGTLIDPHGVTVALAPLVGEDNSLLFSHTWRSKQLEYSFRRGLMKQYQAFTVCTRQALDYACATHDHDLSNEARNALMEKYLSLPAFDDVKPGLLNLRKLDVKLYAFSNGVENDVRDLLESAGLTEFFDGIVSVDEVQSFKPDPEVYLHFLQKTDTRPSDTWLVSSNSFDWAV